MILTKIFILTSLRILAFVLGVFEQKLYKKMIDIFIRALF